MIVVGQQFAIGYEPSETKGLAKSTAMGRTLFSELRLVICNDAAEDQIRDTLLHEVIHACLLMVGINDDEHHEPIVGALTPILLDVLRTNPAVTGYLLERAAA